EREEFCLHYQPIVSIDGGCLLGMEALVRWQHPDQGIIGPDAFIAIAEDTGLIRPLGSWILGQACRQLREWSEAGLPVGVLSVNLSGRQLTSSDLRDSVVDAITATGIRPAQLRFEITESVLMEDVEFSIQLLRGLLDVGVQLAVDDFGTGYSSLSYLKRLPVDTLKIDRSFINRLAVDPHDSAIVAAIVALAQALDLSVTAEGVERREQLDALRELGCQAAQGYLLAPPIAAEDVPGFMTARREARPASCEPHASAFR
ncbi:MAG: diguanylate phosphodiesterase, partial [Acidimicrobiales bacterium]|nr:diguanylate phosphodiesterase [Acidimicrobiales bacterium]